MVGTFCQMIRHIDRDAGVSVRMLEDQISVYEDLGILISAIQAQKDRLARFINIVFFIDRCAGRKITDRSGTRVIRLSGQIDDEIIGMKKPGQEKTIFLIRTKTKGEDDEP